VFILSRELMDTSILNTGFFNFCLVIVHSDKVTVIFFFLIFF